MRKFLLFSLGSVTIWFVSGSISIGEELRSGAFVPLVQALAKAQASLLVLHITPPLLGSHRFLAFLAIATAFLQSMSHQGGLGSDLIVSGVLESAEINLVFFIGAFRGVEQAASDGGAYFLVPCYPVCVL
uniref:Uncharacterized protein n=1 Tax=Daphnia galeata TaxID=27404 RepID=A0A8J2WPC3_9CRUS|nr:unnamed protein product [Daphnia galeata]